MVGPSEEPLRQHQEMVTISAISRLEGTLLGWHVLQDGLPWGLRVKSLPAMQGLQV